MKCKDNIINSEDGAVLIVEASLVFPIMFFILAFLIMCGNIFYQKSKVETIVQQVANESAAQMQLPLLQTVEDTGKVPAFSNSEDTRALPYRYIGKSTFADVEQRMKNVFNKAIAGVGTGIFGQMELQNSGQDISSTNYFVYSKFQVNAHYTIQVPIRLLGLENFLKVNEYAYAESAVTDAPELIRNITTIQHYLHLKTFGDLANWINDLPDPLADITQDK
jgi:hypothetical protein